MRDIYSSYSGKMATIWLFYSVVILTTRTIHVEQLCEHPCHTCYRRLKRQDTTGLINILAARGVASLALRGIGYVES